MSQSVKQSGHVPGTPVTPPAATPPARPYRRVYMWVFQAWLVMFIGVICGALFFYLLSFLPR